MYRHTHTHTNINKTTTFVDHGTMDAKDAGINIGV